MSRPASPSDASRAGGRPPGTPPPTLREPTRWQLFQRQLQRMFSKPSVEIAVAVLVLTSVILTLLELTWWDSNAEAPFVHRLRLINDLMTYGMAVELLLRFLAATSKARYFRDYWLDLISVLPIFRVFRAVRLLRLLRLLRLFGVATRLAWHFPDIVRRGALEYMVVCSLLLLTVVFGTGALMFFEPPGTEGAEGFNLPRSFWFSVYSLFAGEPIPNAPHTLGGRMVAVFVMFMGLTIFAMFTGTVSAFMVERLRVEERQVDCEQLSNHVVICGWSSKGRIIIAELRASAQAATTPIVVIASPRVDEVDRERNVFWLEDDFTRVAALEKAGIQTASTCIVLSDTTAGRSEQDADARTILAALTVEKLNPAVYTCAELLNETYASHLQMGKVNDYVVSSEYGANLLAQAAMSRGLLGVYGELLTYRHGNEMQRVHVSDQWAGRTFQEMLGEVKRSHDAILVAVVDSAGVLKVNPPEHTFAAGEEVIVITRDELNFRNGRNGRK